MKRGESDNWGSFLLIFMIAMTPAFLCAGKYAPLKVTTFEGKEVEVRRAMIGAFEDILESPTIVNTEGYIEVALIDNGFITRELCYVAISFKENDGKTEITAIPFKLINKERIAIENFPLYLGIRIIIEGVAQELDYNHIKVPSQLAGLR